MAEPRKVIDWEAIELHYRSGVRSLRDIADEFGVSNPAIIKRAKRDGWERDLAAKIKAKAEAKVAAAAVPPTPEKLANEREIVEANADAQYRVRIEHRLDIQRSRKLFQSLLGELEDLGAAGDLALQLFETLHDPQAEDATTSESGRKRMDRMRQLLDAVLSTPGRIESGKKLVEMLEKLVRMEREAFGIDDTRTQSSTGSISISF